MKLQMIGLAALLAGTLCSSEPEPEEIKRQNQYVEYRLSQGEIYRIYVKMNDGVTTIQFPSAITEIAGKNISADGKNGDSDFLIQAQAGSLSVSEFRELSESLASVVRILSSL